MSIIDASYFVAELNIPNTGDEAVAERVEWFINKYEPLFLQKLMGYPLFKVFYPGKDATPVDQRFTDIIGGKDFTDYQGYARKWEGLFDDDLKISPIANYVYYWYCRGTLTQSSGLGEVITQSENAVNISPRPKMARAWNEMRQMVLVFTEFMDATLLLDPTVYPEWTYNNKIDSLKYFGFMNPIF